MEQNANEMTNWRELFSLYRNLVGPFQELEKRSQRKWELERTAGSAKGIINFGYKETIGKAFSHTVTWAIPFLIVFYVIMNVVKVNGEKLFYPVEDLLEHLGDMIGLGYISEIVFNTPSLKSGGILAGLIELIFVLLGIAICYGLFPCVLFLFPLMIIRNVISRSHKISKAKKTLKACEEQLPQAEAAIQEAWEGIAPYVKYVPPNYRSSNALAFFSNSFFNFKVKNLQEAVNLYDEHLHKQRMEQGQREMAQAQKDAMDDISRQLDYMEDLINSQEYVIYETHYH